MSIASLYSIVKPVKFAIIPFYFYSMIDESAMIQFTKQFESELEKSPDLTIRRNTQIYDYIEMLEKSQCGLIDNPSAIKEQTKDLLVNYFVVGTVGKSEQNYEIDSRIVDCNTWKIICSHGITIDNYSNAPEIIADAFHEKIKNTSEQKNNSTLAENYISIDKIKHVIYTTSAVDDFSYIESVLTTALSEKKHINTIESQFTKSLIEEKTFEMSGIPENDKSDTMMNIHHINYKICLKLFTFEDMYSLQVKAYSISQKNVVFTQSFDFTSPKAIRSISLIIASIVEDMLSDKISLLQINAPKNTHISIENKFDGTITISPYPIFLEKGTYKLNAILPGYKVITKSVTITQKEQKINLIFERISEHLLHEAIELESQRNYTKAVKKYHQFIDETGESPDSFIALYRIGYIYYNFLHDYMNTKSTMLQLLGKYPPADIRAEAYILLGSSYIELDDLDNAKKTLNYVIQYFPETPTIEMAMSLLGKINTK